MLRRHQVKSRWYYIFWGIATVTVFTGQLYVGSGYREMAKQQLKLVEALQGNNCLKAQKP